MPRPFVEIDLTDLRASMGRMERNLKNHTVFYGRASRHMRDYVRNTITMQGRTKNYATLSQWTRRKTGRRKALITLRRNIRARHDRVAGEVFFQQRDSSWHIDQHHTGFTSPAVVNKRMVVPNQAGGILAVFSNRKASKIPARQVWPSFAETRKEVTRIYSIWLDSIARKSWR